MSRCRSTVSEAEAKTTLRCSNARFPSQIRQQAGFNNGSMFKQVGYSPPKRNRLVCEFRLSLMPFFQQLKLFKQGDFQAQQFGGRGRELGISMQHRFQLRNQLRFGGLFALDELVTQQLRSRG